MQNLSWTRKKTMSGNFVQKFTTKEETPGF